MKFSHLVTAAAAAALMAGAAYAQQTNSTTQPAVVPGTTGLPSNDSTRPTGDQAGRTTLPSGQVNGEASTTTTTTTTETGTTASSATTFGTGASVTTTLVTNGPVPDTPENRAKYGGPMSHAGKHTAPKGN